MTQSDHFELERYSRAEDCAQPANKEEQKGAHGGFAQGALPVGPFRATCDQLGAIGSPLPHNKQDKLVPRVSDASWSSAAEKGGVLVKCL